MNKKNILFSIIIGVILGVGFMFLIEKYTGNKIPKKIGALFLYMINSEDEEFNGLKISKIPKYYVRFKNNKELTFANWVDQSNIINIIETHETQDDFVQYKINFQNLNIYRIIEDKTININGKEGLLFTTLDINSQPMQYESKVLIPAAKIMVYFYGDKNQLLIFNKILQEMKWDR